MPHNLLRMVRYGKRDDMIVYENEPFNAETGLAALPGMLWHRRVEVKTESAQ